MVSVCCFTAGRVHLHRLERVKKVESLSGLITSLERMGMSALFKLILKVISIRIVSHLDSL